MVVKFMRPLKVSNGYIAKSLSKSTGVQREILKTNFLDLMRIGKHPFHLDLVALTEVQNLGNQVRGNFRDWADKYTSSQDICHEYADFLVDGLGPFKETCVWKARADLIERGVRLDIDHAFTSLMNRC
jgi:hypothetical protein